MSEPCLYDPLGCSQSFTCIIFTCTFFSSLPVVGRCLGAVFLGSVSAWKRDTQSMSILQAITYSFLPPLLPFSYSLIRSLHSFMQSCSHAVMRSHIVFIKHLKYALLQADSLPSEPPGKPPCIYVRVCVCYIYTLFQIIFPMGHYRLLSGVLCAIQ